MGHMTGMKCNRYSQRPFVKKGFLKNWYDEQPPQVEELQQAYKDHGIKLNYKQAKRLWDVFKDCNVSTLIF